MGNYTHFCYLYICYWYKQSHSTFPCTTDAAQMCNPISFFVLLLLLVDIKMHHRRIVNHQTASFPYVHQSEVASKEAWVMCTRDVASPELEKQIISMFFGAFFSPPPWFGYGAFLMSDGSFSTPPNPHTTIKAPRALQTCYILHFAFCQEVITTKARPFHSVQCTLIVDDLWRNKTVLTSQRGGTFHTFSYKIVSQQY